MQIYEPRHVAAHCRHAAEEKENKFLETNVYRNQHKYKRKLRGRKSRENSNKKNYLTESCTLSTLLIFRGRTALC